MRAAASWRNFVASVLTVVVVGSLGLLSRSALAEPILTASARALDIKTEHDEEIARRVCGKEFYHDAMKLSVREEGHEVAKLDYCSAYNLGQKTAKVMRDTRNKNFILLEYAEGHGNDASTTYLIVYRLMQDRSFAEIARTEVSVPLSEHLRVSYSYTCETPENGGLRVVMRRRIEKNYDKIPLLRIPRDAVKILRLDVPRE